MFMLGSPYERLKTFGRGIRKALEKQKLLDMPDSKVVTETPEAYKHVVYLQGGSGRDGALFSRCVNEFFAPVENQKYILVKHGRQRGNDRFFAEEGTGRAVYRVHASIYRCIRLCLYAGRTGECFAAGGTECCLCESGSTLQYAAEGNRKKVESR